MSAHSRDPKRRPAAAEPSAACLRLIGAPPRAGPALALFALLHLTGAGPLAGDIVDIVELPVAATATYAATCTVDGAVGVEILNTAAVTAPPDVDDLQAANDSSSDRTWIDVPIFADGFESGDTSAWSGGSRRSDPARFALPDSSFRCALQLEGRQLQPGTSARLLEGLSKADLPLLALDLGRSL